MPRGQVIGQVLQCQRCGETCTKTGYSQKYCAACRGAVYASHWNGYKQRVRAKARLERKPILITCERCRLTVRGRKRDQRFCAPCRQEHFSEQSRRSSRKWMAGNPLAKVSAAARQRKRRRDNPEFAIAARMTASIYQALREGKAGRRWESLVGYTLGDLTAHLERQFGKGMSWANYGQWHIDHIRPVASFTFSTAEDDDFKACWALTNLRPLWKAENLAKSDTLVLLL